MEQRAELLYPGKDLACSFSDIKTDDLLPDFGIPSLLLTVAISPSSSPPHTEIIFLWPRMLNYAVGNHELAGPGAAIPGQSAHEGLKLVQRCPPAR